MSFVRTLIDIHNLLHFPEDFFSVLQQRAGEVERNPSLSRFFDDLLRQMKINPQSKGFGFEACSRNLQFLRSKIERGENPAVDGALLLISAAADCRSYYREQNISERIFIDTFGDITVWAQECLEKTGMWGVTELGWFAHHLSMKLFAFGRLQFELSVLDVPYSVLKAKNAGMVPGGTDTVYIAAGDCPCTADGFLRTKDDPPSVSTSFTTCYRTIKNTGNCELLKAHTVTHGLISPTPSVFNRTDRTEISLYGGMLNVLDTHIPAGSPLEYTACLESFRQALQFPLFADKAPAGFICRSWLLDPCFVRLLPANSRIRRFASLFDIVPPVSIEYEQGINRIFPELHRSFQREKPTSLQRTVREWLSSGGIFRQGQGIRFTTV